MIIILMKTIQTSIVLVRIMAWYKYKQRKAYKKEISKELMQHDIQQDSGIGACQKID